MSSAMKLDRDRWYSLCRALGFVADDTTLAVLSAAFSEPQRAYHTSRHVNECLTWFDAARSCAEQGVLVETAIWFHDAVYQPGAADNEDASASWACEWMQQHSASPVDIATVRSAILATRHDDSPLTADEQLLVDIDLAILGAPARRFDEYEEQVRQEYCQVPEFLFKRRRAALLANFLARPRIYSTAFFFDRLEQPARINLRRSLQKLKQ